VLASQSKISKKSRWKEIKKRRAFLDSLARSKNFNPLDAEKWYSISKKDIMQAGGIGFVQKYYNGSHIKAIIDLYPELLLKKRKFINFSDRNWSSHTNRRKFFDDFATSLNFNPNKAENWYSIKKKDILLEGGGSILNTYYNGSHIRALIDLYPELTLQKEKFVNYTDGDWSSPMKQRQFFDELALSKQFSPLDAEKWYSITQDDVVKAGGSGIRNHYNKSLITALVELYPELVIQRNLFHYSKVHNWKEPLSRRKFLDEFAKSRQFDPLDAAKWSSIRHKDIINAGGRGLLKHHAGSHINALMDLYPGSSFEYK